MGNFGGRCTRKTSAKTAEREDIPTYRVLPCSRTFPAGRPYSDAAGRHTSVRYRELDEDFVSPDFDVEVIFVIRVGKTTAVLLHLVTVRDIFALHCSLPIPSAFSVPHSAIRHVFILCSGTDVVPFPPSCCFGLCLLFVSTGFVLFIIGLEMLNDRSRPTSRSASS
jgi:hypothetical protein